MSKTIAGFAFDIPMNALTTGLIAYGIIRTKRTVLYAYRTDLNEAQARHHTYYNLIVRLVVETGVLYLVILITELVVSSTPQSIAILLVIRLQAGVLVSKGLDVVKEA